MVNEEEEQIYAAQYKEAILEVDDGRSKFINKEEYIDLIKR